MVAIADVAFYVRPGSALDREALKRGNSVYFPDQVVPMLPEALSTDLCSLKEGVDRPCLAVRMVFDAHGHKRDHRFMRGMMRSPAKLSYPEAQAAIDGRPSDKTGPLLEPVLKPLWAAYAVLRKARDKRGPLELDLPERKIILDEMGRVARIVTPERLDAHRLIEEFMIQANVAAAETLEAHEIAAALPHPRRAGRGEGQGADRVPGDARHRPAQIRADAAQPVQPHPRPHQGWRIFRTGE